MDSLTRFSVSFEGLASVERAELLLGLHVELYSSAFEQNEDN